MPKRIKQRWPDVNQIAREVGKRSTSTGSEPSAEEISRVMAALGRRGGKVGGRRRMVTMTPEERRAVAVRAAKARWRKSKP